MKKEKPVQSSLDDDPERLIEYTRITFLELKLSHVLYIRSENKALLLRQLSQMLIAGIPITRAVATIAKQEQIKVLKKSLNDTFVKISGGATLSKAAASHPEIFNPIYIPLIKAGEAAGNMDIVLNDIADHAEEQLRLEKTIITSLNYPIISIIGAFLTLSIIFFFSFPDFIDIFEDMNVSLPALTRFVILFYKTCTDPYNILYFFSITTIMLYIWIKIIKRDVSLRVKIDQYKLYLPLLGNIFKKIALANFARCFALLYKHGLSFMDMFNILSSVTGNVYINLCIKNMVQDITEGSTLAKAFGDLPIAEPMLTSIIAVGEESGMLEILMIKAAEYYEADINNAIEDLLTLIEPATVVALSGVVLIIVLSVFLPLIQLVGNFK